MSYTPVRQRQTNLWREMLHDLRDGATDVTVRQRLAVLEEWRRDPWAYLTGVDPADNRPIIWTVDERDDETPVKPFPGHKTYLKYLTAELWGHRVVFIDKVRQRYVTTLCSLLIDWYAAFNIEREIFVSRVKEESAIKLINDKIRAVYARKPAWLREVMKLDKAPQHVITYEGGSTVTGVSQNFAVSDARGPTGSLIFVDEAAFQNYFVEIYRAVQPMAARLWAVSTANIGNAGAELFKSIVHEARPGASDEGEQQEESDGE